MASMSNIGELVKNIHLCGNSKFYVQEQNQKSALAVKFLVDEADNLNVTKVIESFDKLFWNSDRKDESTNREEAIEVVNYSEEDMPIVISTIVYSSFYNGRAALTFDKVTPKT